MRLIKRTDTPLAAGLIASALILFHQPLRFGLDAVHEIEGDYHLDLLPALIVLTAVFVFHQHRKRRETHAEMLEAAAESRQHLARALELEALVRFGRMLASALDLQGLRHAVSRCLSEFSGERGIWVLVTRQSRWEVLSIDPITEHELPKEALEQVASTALASLSAQEDTHGEGIAVESFVCFPLVVGSTAIGVLGIKHTGNALEGGTRRAIGVAASLLSIAIRNVHLLLEAQELSVHDSLTGCVNRKPGMELLETELRRARRTGLPLSVLMLDVDEFKQVNDRFGHICGDVVLGTIGRHLVHSLRASDVKCRYGGDEFILILPETPFEGAEHVASALSKAIAAQRIEHEGQMLSVTVSIGIALVKPGDLDSKAIIDRADRALYDAKRAGRNRWSGSAA